MEVRKLKAKFAGQKCGAKNRGIEWKLTFEEWINWWGDDIEKRGTGHDKLQMQRYGDKGAYELGNIKKGYPKDNRATWAKTVATRKAEKAKQEHEAWLNALMYQPSNPPKDYEDDEESIEKEIKSNGVILYARFAIDR